MKLNPQITLHPPYALYSKGTGLEMTAYELPPLNKKDFKGWWSDGMSDKGQKYAKSLIEFENSKVTVNIQKGSNYAILVLSGFKGKTEELETGIDITSLADRLEFYQEFVSIAPVVDNSITQGGGMQWFVRLLPEKVKEEESQDEFIALEAKKRYPYPPDSTEARINKLSSKRRRFIEGAQWMRKVLTGLGH